MSKLSNMSKGWQVLFCLILLLCGIVEGYFISEMLFEEERYKRIDQEIHAAHTMQNFSDCEMFILNQSINRGLNGVQPNT